MNKLLKLSRIWSAKARLHLLRILGVKHVRIADGPRMMANWNDATFWFCAASMYEPHYRDFLKSLNAPFVFVDIGANQGFFSLLAANNLFASEIHCFEPIPATYELLTQNLSLNECKNTHIHKVAIAESAGTSSIFIQPGHSGVASMRSGNILPTSHSINIETVDHVFLSDLLRNSELPIHVKVDVEGFELEVVRQLSKANWFSHVESIFYEVDESWASPFEIKALLEDLGFRRFTKIGPSDAHYDVHAARGTLGKK